MAHVACLPVAQDIIGRRVYGGAGWPCLCGYAPAGPVPIMGGSLPRQGPAQSKRWYDYGDYFSLAAPGYHSQRQATVMASALAAGTVAWWVERVPSERPRSFIRHRFLNTPAD
jgi:hypothetical protein